MLFCDKNMYLYKEFRKLFKSLDSSLHAFFEKNKIDSVMKFV
jgi:hypothetical protein